LSSLFQAAWASTYCIKGDFETPACKLYLLFISADAAQEKEKKVLLPTGVSKSAAHTVCTLKRE
jgi:hypothetical protein